MSDPMVEALRRLISRTDGGRVAVAQAIHANEQTLYQIVAGVPLASGKPRGIGRDLRDRLTRAYPNWLELSETGPAVNAAEPTPPPYRNGPESNPMAHSVSLEAFDTPPSMQWGEVMNGAQLPRVFILSIEDDALVGRVPKGTRVVFDCSAAPKIGRPILVADRAGNRFVRLYADVRGSRWRAITTDPLYASLDSVDDGLQILACAAWIEA